MNYRFIAKTIAKTFWIVISFMLISMSVSIYYKESTFSAFLGSIVLMLPFACLSFLKTDDKSIKKRVSIKDGFIVVSFSWIFISIFGALPFLLSGAITNPFDAFYESVSGFTTTGSTILVDIESIDRGILFWRSLTHWLGGMGVIMLLLTVNNSSTGESIHVLRAEVPGPSVEKLVPRIGDTAKLLYGIYLILSIVLCGTLILFGMPIYDAVVSTFSTAGTGGFAIYNDSLASQSPAIQWITAVGMLMFGLNFTLFYYLKERKYRNIIESEETRYYIGLVIIATIIMVWSLLDIYPNLEENIRVSFFQFSSIISTTGYSSVSFISWPAFTKSFLLMAMFIGASSGSTAGGLKISRVLIIAKGIIREIKKMASPHKFIVVRLEGKPVDEYIVKGAAMYLILYIFVISISTLLLSLEGYNLETTFSLVVGSFNNGGQSTGEFAAGGLSLSMLHNYSKLILSIDMLLGRLEIYPLLILVSPSTWKRLG